MNERIFLDRAIEELEQLTEENNELKRQVSLYEKFVNDVKELLSDGTMNNEER